jgi:Methyltransferase domain
VSRDWSGSARRRVPWFHENALLRLEGRDDDPADDGVRCTAGEMRDGRRLGCPDCLYVGTGIAAHGVHVVPQGSVTGVDLSPGMIEVAGHLELPEGSAPIEYLVGAAEDLPMQARSRAGGGQVG